MAAMKGEEWESSPRMPVKKMVTGLDNPFVSDQYWF